MALQSKNSVVWDDLKKLFLSVSAEKQRFEFANSNPDTEFLKNPTITLASTIEELSSKIQQMTSNEYLQSVANTSGVGLPKEGEIITPVALASLAAILNDIEDTVGIGAVCTTHYATHELVGTCSSHRTDNTTFHNSFDSGFFSSDEFSFDSSDDSGFNSNYGTAKSVCSGFDSSEDSTVCNSFNFSDRYGRGSGSRGEFCSSFSFGSSSGYGSYDSSDKSSACSSDCNQEDGSCSCYDYSFCDVYNFSVATKGAFCPSHYNSGFNATFNFNSAGFNPAANIGGYCAAFNAARYLFDIL